MYAQGGNERPERRTVSVVSLRRMAGAAVIFAGLGAAGAPAQAQPSAQPAPPVANDSAPKAAEPIPVTMAIKGGAHLLYEQAGIGRTEPGADATSLLRVRRARVALVGTAYDPRLSYFVQTELTGSSLSLRDAYLDFAAARDAAHVRVGQFKVPFSRQELISPFRQQTVDTPIASDAFAFGWDTGAMLWGKLAGGRVEYYGGVFNGEGANARSQQDGDLMRAARIVVAPLGAVPYEGGALGATARPRVSLAANVVWNGGWLYDLDGDGALEAPTSVCGDEGCAVDAGDDASVRSAGLEAVVLWRRMAVTAELFERRVEGFRADLPILRARGGYVDAAVMVLPTVELGGRFARLHGDGGSRASEWAPFANVYLRGQDLKLQTDFTTRTNVFEGERGSPERRLRLQLVAYLQ